MSKVSIVIPIYNAEKYIEKCLKSVINQTYKNIEIICVDNNSSDNSLELVKKYAKNDNRIKIEKEKRKGVSFTRNKGIDISTGDYISFIDADDFVEQNFIEKLLQGIQEKGDISIVSFSIINGKYKNEISNRINNRIFLTKEEILKKIFLRNEFCAFCWNKLYKAQIIKENNLRFSIKQEICEDLLFNLDYIKNSKDGGWYDSVKTYNYVQNINSSYNSLNIEKWNSVFLLENYVENLNVLKTEKQINNWKFFYIYILLDYRERCYLLKRKKEESKIKKKIGILKKDVFYNKSVDIMSKIKIMIKIYIPKISVEVKKYRRKKNES